MREIGIRCTSCSHRTGRGRDPYPVSYAFRGTGDFIDIDCLIKRDAHCLCHDPRNSIIRTARGKRNHLLGCRDNPTSQVGPLLPNLMSAAMAGLGG